MQAKQSNTPRSLLESNCDTIDSLITDLNENLGFLRNAVAPVSFTVIGDEEACGKECGEPSSESDVGRHMQTLARRLRSTIAEVKDITSRLRV